MAEDPVGRVFLGKKGGSSRNNNLTAPVRASAKYRILGYAPNEGDPISNWRPSKFMKKGTRKPKRFRVRLREQVAREAREIQTRARQYALGLMEEAARIAGDRTEPASARLQAMDMIWNRAYGKPNQTNTNLNADINAKTEQATAAELDNRIAEALAQFEKLTGGAAKAAKGAEQPADIRKHDRNPDGSGSQLH